MEKPKHRILNVNIPDELYRRLALRALDDRTSKTAIIKEALDKYLKKGRKK